MPRCTYAELNHGLDQLYMMPLIEGEQIHDRMEAVEKYKTENGWTNDMIIDELIKETDPIITPKTN